MTEPVFWATLGAIGGCVLAAIGFATFWMRISSRITTAEQEAENANDRAMTAGAKIDLVQSNLTDYRQHAAEHFASMDDLNRLESRHENQFGALRGDLRDIASRLDRLLEAKT